MQSRFTPHILCQIYTQPAPATERVAHDQKDASSSSTWGMTQAIIPSVLLKLVPLCEDCAMESIAPRHRNMEFPPLAQGWKQEMSTASMLILTGNQFDEMYHDLSAML